MHLRSMQNLKGVFCGLDVSALLSIPVGHSSLIATVRPKSPEAITSFPDPVVNRWIPGQKTADAVGPTRHSWEMNRQTGSGHLVRTGSRILRPFSYHPSSDHLSSVLSVRLIDHAEGLGHSLGVDGAVALVQTERQAVHKVPTKKPQPGSPMLSDLVAVQSGPQPSVEEMPSLLPCHAHGPSACLPWHSSFSDGVSSLSWYSGKYPRLSRGRPGFDSPLWSHLLNPGPCGLD